MDFENKKAVPDGIKILGWLISLCAFALGFYHTAEGMKYFKPLGFEGGAFIVSGLISMMLIVAYSRALAGIKAALYFYIICALFNFTFNLNSFYPNLNSRKLLQEEAQLIKDTILHNLTLEGKIIALADQSDIQYLEIARDQCIDEIKSSKGYGPYAKKQLKDFNRRAAKYGKKPIDDGSFGLTNPNIANIIKKDCDRIINELKNGQAIDKDAAAAKENFDKLAAYSKSDSDSDEKDKKTFLETTVEEINENDQARDEDTAAWRKSINNLKKLVELNDQAAISFNKIPGIAQKMKTFNSDKNAQLLYPKTKEIGTFAHTLSSIWQRIDKIDTWGVLFLVFFIDFIVPFGVYFLIRRSDDQHNNGMGGTEIGFFEKLFGKKKPTKF